MKTLRFRQALFASAGRVAAAGAMGLHCGNDSYSHNAVTPGRFFGTPMDSDIKLAGTMSSYWVNFARTGDPIGPGLPEWPRDDATPQGKVLRMGDYVTVETLPSESRLEILDRIFEAQRPAPRGAH